VSLIEGLCGYGIEGTESPSTILYKTHHPNLDIKKDKSNVYHNIISTSKD
jgi:hypothetical protein